MTHGAPARARLVLLPLANRVTAAELEALDPHAPLLACDFLVEGAEHGAPHPWGWQLGRIANVDHHAPVPRMARRVSSVHLALERLAAEGPAGAGEVVVLNHTDCDSVLTAALLLGDLPPDPALAAAALAADHTGAPDDLADVLQALDDRRDYALSLASARAVLAGAPLGAEAAAALARRRADRAAAAALVDRGVFRREAGGVWWATLDRELDGELLPALLPEARVIMTAAPMAGVAGRWVVKLRLGWAAPAGMTLGALGVEAFDPAYGGRWNAGSNKRGGGTGVRPGRYAAMVGQGAGGIDLT